MSELTSLDALPNSASTYRGGRLLLALGLNYVKKVLGDVLDYES